MIRRNTCIEALLMKAAKNVNIIDWAQQWVFEVVAIRFQFEPWGLAAPSGQALPRQLPNASNVWSAAFLLIRLYLWLKASIYFSYLIPHWVDSSWSNMNQDIHGIVKYMFLSFWSTFRYMAVAAYRQSRSYSKLCKEITVYACFIPAFKSRIKCGIFIFDLFLMVVYHWSP